MIPSKLLPIITIGLIVFGGRLPLWAEGDVTIVPAPNQAATTPKSDAAGDTPVVHKSSHKKKPKTTDATSTDATASTTTPATATSGNAIKDKADEAKTPASGTAKKGTATAVAPTPPKPGAKLDAHGPNGVATAPNAPATPAVETGLPVPRRTAPNIASLPVVPAGYQNLPNSYSKSLVALAPPAVSSTGLSSYSSLPKPARSQADFTFADFPTHHSRNTYPWKTGIITTMFFIGEGGSSISATDNVASSWDADWKENNHGTDTPGARRGYAPAGHAATLNTFYVALPFNDMSDPEAARRWLPASWHRPNVDGKPVSACKDRWVRIKNAQGRSCYAQWEDVGPLETDNPEYVFGNGRPTSRYSGAGLDVSPAVAQYLGIDGNKSITSWQFVDDEDVIPGPWLTYDEEALLYKAMHMRGAAPIQSIQDNADPSEDPSTINNNRQRAGAAKG